MKVEVYQLLLDLNRGFQQVIASLGALRTMTAFDVGELDRFAALSKETRAAANSYLVSIIESVETAEAGRRYVKRRRREKQEESGG
jgi:hypothetical protein